MKKLKLKYFYYKFLLIGKKLNGKLPRFMRITKYSLLTTFAAFLVASGIMIVNARSCSNMEVWMGDQSCDGASQSGGNLGAVISTANSFISGTTEEVPDTEGAIRIKGSLLVALNNLIVKTYDGTDEVSGTKYIADKVEEAGIVQPVQAQVPGYTTFEPVLNIWEVFRNLSLSLIIVIGLILAFMILFRVQQGQGYVTIMNSLPKIVLAVVMIIFSYSMAGLIVDFGNVAQRLTVNLFFNEKFIDSTFYGTQNATNPAYPLNIYADHNYNNKMPDGGQYESNLRDMNIFRLVSRFTEFESWDPSGNNVNITDIIRTPTNIGILDSGLDFIGNEHLPAPELLKLIITIVIITGVVKIFFALVKAFAEMIIYTIFAPVIFLFMPLSAGAFTSWLRRFLASSLLFPATFLMLFLAAIISGVEGAPWVTKSGQATIAGIAPDLLLYSVNRKIGPKGEEFSFLTRILGLTIVMMIPTLPQFLQQQLQVAENVMVEGAKQSFRNVATKIPFVGGLFNM